MSIGTLGEVRVWWPTDQEMLAEASRLGPPTRRQLAADVREMKVERFRRDWDAMWRGVDRVLRAARTR